ncbi:MAG: 16S rRNA (guanine(966)-N(2))-methyltransferase RsmD [Myxococcota bacterium]
MRVTGGRFAGRRLRVPRDGVRPSADRVRESLFARLGDLAGQRVLDLYAGSGALGFEALSRGAAHVTFVDRSRAALDVIRENAEALGVAEEVTLRREPAEVCLKRLTGGAPFDLVLMDPPYADRGVPGVLGSLARSGLLAPAGLVVVESDRRHAPGSIEGLAALDERRYGDTLISRYVPAGEPPRPAVGSEAQQE